MNIQIHEREIHKDGGKSIKRTVKKSVKFTNRLKAVKIFYIKIPGKICATIEDENKMVQTPCSLTTTTY